jgi:hypothetical protein
MVAMSTIGRLREGQVLKELIDCLKLTTNPCHDVVEAENTILPNTGMVTTVPYELH